MTELQYHLSKNMKAYRKKLGFSQEALAEKAETSSNYISLIEQGRKFPSPRILERIAAALNIHSIELFSQEYTPNAHIEQVQQEILDGVKNTIIAAFNRAKQ